jgi:glycosyltransferase involved in cell wall biosynthesis
MTRSVLYISYDGLEEPLGRSQVLPYVLGLATLGHRTELLTFEKPGVPLVFRRPLAPGVYWTSLRYHRRPSVPATTYDMGRGLATLFRLARLSNADLLHARSYVPAAAALPLARWRDIPLILDTRGFLFDERADAGAWPREGALYRGAKRVEAMLFRQAGAITVLTHDMQRYLRGDYAHAAEVQAPIWVIPTCADLDLFTPDGPRDEGLAARLDGARVLVYLGAFGPSYLAEEMARFYLCWKRCVGTARFLVVSTHAPTVVRRVLASAGAENDLVHVAAARDQVPPLIRWAEAAVLFFPATFSKRGSAPTKLAELLGCGIPMAVSPIGDVEAMMCDQPAGVMVRSWDNAALERAAEALAERSRRPEVRRSARTLAESWFGLKEGISAYDALYASLPRRGPTLGVADAGWPRPPVTRAV